MKWRISFVLLGVLALLTVVSRVEQELHTDPTTDQLVSSEVEQLVLTRYDRNGRPLETSRAARTVHFEGESQTHFDNVVVEHEDARGLRWVLQSPGGVSESQEETLTLLGGVTITRGNDLTLKTQEVTVDMVTSEASSSHESRLVSNRGTTVASGLLVDFNAGTAALQGDVVSRYRAKAAAQ